MFPSTTRSHAMRRLLPLAAAVLLTATAHADESTHVGIALTGGLSGIGADLAVNINDYVGVRATVADFSLKRTSNFGTSVSWDATLKLFQAGALLDLYPFAGGFRVSAGVIQDDNKFTLNGTPAGGSFTFNGTNYPASQVGSANASVNWSKAVPYVGLGWGNLAGSRGLHFTSDFGVLITGSPTSSVNAICNLPGGCGSLTTDVAAEQTKLQNDVHGLSFWPVLRVGVGYAF